MSQARVSKGRLLAAGLFGLAGGLYFWAGAPDAANDSWLRDPAPEVAVVTPVVTPVGAPVEERTDAAPPPSTKDTAPEEPKAVETVGESDEVWAPEPPLRPAPGVPIGTVAAAPLPIGHVRPVWDRPEFSFLVADPPLCCGGRTWAKKLRRDPVKMVFLTDSRALSDAQLRALKRDVRKTLARVVKEHRRDVPVAATWVDLGTGGGATLDLPVSKAVEGDWPAALRALETADAAELERVLRYADWKDSRSFLFYATDLAVPAHLGFIRRRDGGGEGPPGPEQVIRLLPAPAQRGRVPDYMLGLVYAYGEGAEPAIWLR